MPGKPQSEATKAHIKRSEQDHVMDLAVAAYQAELAKTGPEKKKGLRAICTEISKEWRKKTGREVTLNHGTLNRLAKGGARLTTFNANKGWLLPEEVEVVIEYATDMAACGFPLTHKLLKEHVDEICHSRLGDKFPAEGVGKKWTTRFLEKHSDHLSTYTSRPLKDVRGRAVNPATNKAWFELLGEVLEKGDDGQPIAQECCYGVDEAGFQPEIGGSSNKAIGGKGKRVQHEQQGGGRENTTVIVTICADGTSIPPAVIFKGKSYQASWKQNNPTNAS